MEIPQDGSDNDDKLLKMVKLLSEEISSLKKQLRKKQKENELLLMDIEHLISLLNSRKEDVSCLENK